MYGCVSVVLGRRGYGKCEQHCGLAGADAVAGGRSHRVSVVEVESRRYQSYRPLFTLFFPSSSLIPTLLLFLLTNWTNMIRA